MEKKMTYFLYGILPFQPPALLEVVKAGVAPQAMEKMPDGGRVPIHVVGIWGLKTMAGERERAKSQ